MLGCLVGFAGGFVVLASGCDFDYCLWLLVIMVWLLWRRCWLGWLGCLWSRLLTFRCLCAG